MKNRLACAIFGTSLIIVRSPGAALLMSACNDNERNVSDDRMLWEALRHFARHGLHAAAQAADSAQAALAAGDQQGFAWWLAICRKLDRRMSETLARHSALAS
ncbi:MAG: hypothetical protein N2423_01475 [Novosphingobium sp.]|nr:hypothetical protein [Novosphingobium sp.]